MSREELGRQFRELHESGTFLLGNAWDVGSALVLEHAGFPAIGTTSSGFAFSLGRHDAAARREEVLEHVARLAQSVNVPLSVDGEDGYGATSEEVAASIRAFWQAGASGASIEDRPRDRGVPLFELEVAVERVRAACEAAAALPTPFTVVARAECFLAGVDDPLGNAIERLNRYREVGADCVYAPGPADPEVIATLLREVPAPHNVLARRGLSLALLRDLGVRRVSLGGSLAWAAMGALAHAAGEILEEGSFEFQRTGLPSAQIRAILSPDR